MEIRIVVPEEVLKNLRDDGYILQSALNSIQFCDEAESYMHSGCLVTRW